MRILFTRFPLTSVLGGAEIQTLNLIEGFRTHGHEVIFLGSCPILLQECFERGIKTIPLQLGAPPVTKWRALSFPLWKGRARHKLMQQLELLRDVDRVCMLSLTEKLVGTQWFVDHHIPVVWIEHDRIGRWLKRNPALPQLKRLSESVTTVAVSQLSRRLYLDLGFPEDRVVAIPNGVDPTRFGDVQGTVQSGNILRVGCIARLSPEKGVFLLIDAVAELPDTALTIVGTGPLREALERRIARLNDASPLPRLALLPHVEDLGSFYRSIDVLVLPSVDHDPFGLVAAEAMLLGIPVVVTTKTGIAAELRHQHDALVIEPTPDAMRSALLGLQSPYLRSQLRENGLTTSREKFTAERMVEAYEKILTSARQAD